MKKFDYSIFIGRFQPFHLAHYSLLKKALKEAENTIVVLGSYKRARDPKNPWTGEEREAMMRVALTDEENARVKVIFMRDYLYNDNLWLIDLQQKISEATNNSDNIVLVGHEHDSSSYYLKLFPQWEFIAMDNIDELPHATNIRSLYYNKDESYKQYLHEQTSNYLDFFSKTKTFEDIVESAKSIEEYKNQWKNVPFEPTFVTVDSLVIKSGHILVVKRKKAYGKGLYALPGGFLNTNENIEDGALRELKEETIIDVDRKILKFSIIKSKVFDSPNRSLRGRAITHAFLINLGMGNLPKVQGSDDASHAVWMPLREISSNEDKFFEDHFYIINYFVCGY